MQVKLVTEREVSVYYIGVVAGVRYWEDATVNGVEDTDGTLIPCRVCDLWRPAVDIVTGCIKGWPIGTTAKVHYKVCDAVKYYLVGAGGCRVAEYIGDYVPDEVLSVVDGFGDYIIWDIDANGHIDGWRTPTIDSKEWRLL